MPRERPPYDPRWRPPDRLRDGLREYERSLLRERLRDEYDEHERERRLRDERLSREWRDFLERRLRRESSEEYELERLRLRRCLRFFFDFLRERDAEREREEPERDTSEAESESECLRFERLRRDMRFFESAAAVSASTSILVSLLSLEDGFADVVSAWGAEPLVCSRLSWWLAVPLGSDIGVVSLLVQADV